jgi:CRP-like cAMP-binding protein
MKKEFSKNMDGLNEFITSAKGIEDLKKLSNDRDVRNYKKKENIYTEDGYPRGVYFVVKGKVKTYRTHEQGKEFITGLYKEGDFFGYLALLEEGKYTDSAMTLEDSEVCLIPKEDFFSLVYQNAEVSRKFIKMLSDNLQEKEEHLIKLAYNSVRKRVAEALVTLSNRYKKDGEQQFSMNISREDLANLAGTATETTIRTLSEFKEDGLIDIKGGTIAVSNYDKLVKMRN